MNVKICGLTSKDDATWALNYGADFLGINFYKESPRHMSLKVASWVSQLPSFAKTVGVFVDHSIEEILKTVQELKLKGIQLHGHESPEFVAQLKAQLKAHGLSAFVIKAIRVETESSLDDINRYADADYFLLDAATENALGGTGERFDWDLALKAKATGKPIFLAGGLNPGNVKEAVKKVQPFAVDVASGVESSARKKDKEKMQDFIQGAKGR